MKVLSLDSATTTGFAVGDEHSFQNRSVAFGSFRAPKREIAGERLLIFHDRLTDLVNTHAPEMIVWEAPYFPLSMVTGQKPQRNRFSNRSGLTQEKDGPQFNVNTIIFLHNLAGVIQLVAAKQSLPVESYSSSQWRPTILGGPVPRDIDKKRAVRMRAKALGFNVERDDESDAIGILMHALHGPPAALRAQGDLLQQAVANL